jgi:hypothetical protein
VQPTPWSCALSPPPPDVLMLQYVLRRACLAPNDAARKIVTVAEQML